MAITGATTPTTNPAGVPDSRVKILQPIYAQSIVRLPWAKFTIRATSKITVSPAAIRNSKDAPAMPVSP
jgi:hypothetical protein